ncbi:MAG: hypothetical protein ACR2P4_10540 [Gammaproteobacteria bacterium]
MPPSVWEIPAYAGMTRGAAMTKEAVCFAGLSVRIAVFCFPGGI